MQAHSNPLYEQGEKNVFCPYYRECLDYACNNCWEYWSCLDCEHRCKKEAIAGVFLSAQNSDPYYSLSPSLYLKDRDSLYNWS